MGLFSFLFKKKSNKDFLDYYPDAVLIISSSGEILVANPKMLELFNTTVSEFGEYELFDLFDGGYNLISGLVESGASTIVKSKVHTEEDMYLEIRAAKSDIDERIIITVRDVSNSQRMLNKLLFEHEYLNKLNRDKNTFLSKISAELTSPLHSINGFSQAVLEGLGGDINMKQEKYLKIINKNSTQLLELIEKLLDYSRLESGIYDYEFKKFDIVNMITGIFNEYKVKAEEKKLILNFDLNGLLKRNAYSDENIIKKVIVYLLENAIKNTDIGTISVSLSHPDISVIENAGFSIPSDVAESAYLMFQITDASTVLTESEKDTIFDPYANVDSSMAKKSILKSLSFGVIYNLVRILKGKMWVTPEEIKGVTYTFIIPSEKMGI